jgi:hypothetical protein
MHRTVAQWFFTIKCETERVADTLGLPKVDAEVRREAASGLAVFRVL